VHPLRDQPALVQPRGQLGARFGDEPDTRLLLALPAGAVLEVDGVAALPRAVERGVPPAGGVAGDAGRHALVVAVIVVVEWRAVGGEPAVAVGRADQAGVGHGSGLLRRQPHGESVALPL